MRKTLFLLAFLVFQINTAAQSAAEVDSIVRSYPKNIDSTDKLAQLIRNDFSTDFGRARAVFSWLAFNINYDVKSYLHPKPAKRIKYKTEEDRIRKVKQLHDKMIAKVLRKHKAVCSGYSEVFNEVALKVGLESQVNEGDAKTKLYDIGRRRVKVSHAWNSVKIDGTWRLLDATWGAGYVNLKKEKFYRNFNDTYFDTEPKLFFMRHYPKKGIWFDTVVDKDAFLKAPLVQKEILNGKYKIIEPQNGIIEICPDDNVKFKILNADSDADIQYSLKNQDETGLVENAIQNESTLEFNIKIDRSIGRYLTLYVDGYAIATFKVNRYKF